MREPKTQEQIKIEKALVPQVWKLAQFFNPNVVVNHNSYGDQYEIYNHGYWRSLFTRIPIRMLGVFWFGFWPTSDATPAKMEVHIVFYDPELRGSGLAEQIKYLFEQEHKEALDCNEFTVEVVIHDYAA